ncbi:addiction module RelE/StbE family toxin [Rhizobium sp. BK196]|nr:addiction module RelE/StbE family toxin [Rhizobium sp. BK196]
MKLTWSVFALSDRDAIFTYIEAENPSAAILVDERIVAAVRRLIDFPASGRVGRIAGTRELVINGTPYVAAYAISNPYSSRPPWRAGMARHFANELGFVLGAEN